MSVHRGTSAEDHQNTAQADEKKTTESTDTQRKFCTLCNLLVSHILSRQITIKLLLSVSFRYTFTNTFAWHTTQSIVNRKIQPKERKWSQKTAKTR